MSEKELYSKIIEEKNKLSQLLTDHWNLYSDMSTWYFWYNLMVLIIPLIILYICIDRKSLFEISFFGYSLHIIWYNVGSFLSSNNYFNYPHSLTPFLPQGFSVTAVLYPVTFMLLYQYCKNNGKSFCIYSIFGALIFEIYDYFSMITGLIRLHNGMNLFISFLLSVAMIYLAFGMTKLFKKIKNAE